MRKYGIVRQLMEPEKLPMASPALLEALKPTPQVARSQRPAPAPVTGSNYAMKALIEEALAVARAQQGTRNNTLHIAAVKLGSLVGAGLFEVDVVEASLLMAADRCDLPEEEARKTIQSGMRYGMANPREVKS